MSLPPLPEELTTRTFTFPFTVTWVVDKKTNELQSKRHYLCRRWWPLDSPIMSDFRTTWKLLDGKWVPVKMENRDPANHVAWDGTLVQVPHANMDLELFLALLIVAIFTQLKENHPHIKRPMKAKAVKRKILTKTIPLAHQRVIFEWAESTKSNNIVTRHVQASCGDLREFDISTPLNVQDFEYKFRCYGCNELVNRNHPVYVFSCVKCGSKFQKYRHLKRNLVGQFAVVVGGRTKLGHQVIIKLLDAGANVIATSRFPCEAVKLFAGYPEWKKDEWNKRLRFYPESFDLNTGNISGLSRRLETWISNFSSKIDIFVMCAAQTIRVREKRNARENAEGTGEKNRYGDPLYVDPEHVNSWDMRIGDFAQDEMEEVFRINATAPVLMFQGLLPLLKKSERPFVINVHAREGLFNVSKHDKHLHTNMAKAGLAMFTKCTQRASLRTDGGKRVSIHGCDPGWISVDEYHKDSRPWIVPPLDEVDGAARILYPVMANLTKGSMKTRRHFDQLLY